MGNPRRTVKTENGVSSWELRCETCLYWDNWKCKRHPPFFSVSPSDGSPLPGWPIVDPTNFCGEHDLREPIGGQER